MEKFKNFLLILALLALSSCLSTPESINDSFVKKYSKKVKEINKQRILSPEQRNEVVSSTAPSQEQINDYVASQEKYQGYVPVYQVGEYVPRQFFPDRSTIDQLGNNNPANSVPSDIFEIKYNLANHPPYSYNGAQFDLVKVPNIDAYGNTSISNDKQYVMIANSDIQNSVNKINRDRSDEDLEFSKILIAEKKNQIKQKRAQQLFKANNDMQIALIEDYPVVKRK